MLEGIPIADLTAPTLVGITVLLLLTGRLIPRSTLTDKAEEAEKWRLAYEKERENREELQSNMSALLEVSKTSEAFMRAVFANSEQIKQRQEST